MSTNFKTAGLRIQWAHLFPGALCSPNSWPDYSTQKNYYQPQPQSHPPQPNPSCIGTRSHKPSGCRSHKCRPGFPTRERIDFHFLTLSRHIYTFNADRNLRLGGTALWISAYRLRRSPRLMSSKSARCTVDTSQQEHVRMRRLGVFDENIVTIGGCKRLRFSLVKQKYRWNRGSHAAPL